MRGHFRNALLLAALALPSARSFAQRWETTGDTSWLPVTEAEKQMKTPVVDASAGVEAIFWRVFVGDQRGVNGLERVVSHYVRLKVFGEKGKEKASTIDIEYGGRARIENVAGRTIKPDGAIVELTRDAVHDRDVVRVGGVRRRARSFAMPAVEPGAIVEYRWREYREGSNIRRLRLEFAREFPIQKMTFFVKPLGREVVRESMGLKAFNFETPPRIERNSSGYTAISLENVPALQVEPFMPPEPTLRPWALIHYQEEENPVPEKYWPKVGKRLYRELKADLKPHPAVKEAALKAVEGAASDEEKILRLVQHLRRNVRDFFGGDVTDEERAQIAKRWDVRNTVRPAPEILESRVAIPAEMNLLFAAMASQAGLDARPALVSDQDDIPFQPELADAYFLPDVDMAVRIGGVWKVYDVSARLLPPEMLSWRAQGGTALVADPDKPEFVRLPASSPEQSTVWRRAKLTLDGEGGMEGDVEETWSGHKGADRREELQSLSEARRQENIEQTVRRIFPSASVSAIRVENAESAVAPLKVSYHVKVPEYAIRTGRRLLFAPFYFQRGERPLFPSSERRQDIQFRYAWREKDEVAIQLPAGFDLERGRGPERTDFGAGGFQQTRLTSPRPGELLVERELVFGDKGALAFPRENYWQLKRSFGEIHARDQQMVSLRKPE